MDDNKIQRPLEPQIVFHGSNLVVNSPEIRITKYKKDFGWGFYTTKIEEQAISWAARRALSLGGKPTVSRFLYTPNPTLKILEFETTTKEWLDFVALCRHGKTHPYDIVEGPMADDRIWNDVEDYLSGALPYEAFKIIAQFKKPTHQLSFHTVDALLTLSYLDSVEVEQ